MKSEVISEDIRNVIKEILPSANNFSGKTVLITGGAGFLGQYFIGVLDYLNKKYLDKPCKIISVDNFITGVTYWADDSPNFVKIRHNIKNPLEIDGEVHFIIHAAGIGSPKFYRRYKIETLDVSAFGTKNMLELAKEKDVTSMMCFSSSEIYGDPDPKFIPTPETYNGNVSCTGPRSNYDEGKRVGEALCIAYFDTFKIPVKIVRPFNVYGPGMRLDDARVIPNFVSHAFNGSAIPVYGQGQHTRTFCYINDAMVGFFKVLLSNYDGEPFNVGDDKLELTIIELAKITKDIFEKEFDTKVEIKHVPALNDAYETADPKRRCPDLSKIKSMLNYNPKINLNEGIQRYIAWVQETQLKKVTVISDQES